ncbi:MAG: hypothetical protein H6901_07925 [Rhodobacteraceae bacterium]|nr:hypothetical protein [Paracoccaceae bacterium]MCP5342126.1 hypothetical protein [Paracoccaceae bacterium]
MKSLAVTAFFLMAAPALASAPVVVDAAAHLQDGEWTIDVTISHPDSGWDHYASGWEVIAPDGAVLGYRELTHPHVNEQPFTRSLSGVIIPADVDHVFIRPRCTLDGWVSTPTRLDISRN